MSYMDPVNQLPFAVSEGLGVPMPTPERPTLPGPAPGPFGMNPQVADMLAQAIYGSLQGMGPINPHARQADQFGQAFLRSALGAVAAPRVQAMGERKAEQQRIHEANLKATEDYRKQIGEAGKQLREHRFKMQEEAAKGADQLFPTPAELVKLGYPERMKASDAENAMRTRFPEKYRAPKSEGGSGSRGGMAGMYDATDPEAIADAIASGIAPPDVSQYGRVVAGAVATILYKKHKFNLSTERMRYDTRKQFYRTLNLNQQLRLRQSFDKADHTLDYASQLNDEVEQMIPRSQFNALNRGANELARNGVFGPEATAKIQNLTVQALALQSELATIYQGGGTPTDENKKLAARIINPDMSPARLRAAIQAAKRDIEFAKQAYLQTREDVPPGADPNPNPTPTNPPADDGFVIIGGMRVRKVKK